MSRTPLIVPAALAAGFIRGSLWSAPKHSNAYWREQARGAHELAERYRTKVELREKQLAELNEVLAGPSK